MADHIDTVIARPCHVYGPNFTEKDNRAFAQFLRNAINGEDIVLKSTGTQYFSYTYMADAVSGLLTVLLCGESGEAYNIADVSSDIMLKDLAAIIAETAGKQVVFELPDAVEASGYSTATKARLDGSKLKALGWKPAYDITAGLRRTISVLKEII